MPVYWIGVSAYRRYKEEGRLTRRVFSIAVFAVVPFAYMAAMALGYSVSGLWPLGIILVEQWGLAEKRNTQFGGLSGGQKQRLFISLALLNDPQIVFLDELTSGLDPQARRATWDMVRAIREQGKTVVLITHFMDEVEALADRVAVIDHGRVIALDTPDNLIGRLNGETKVLFSVPNGFEAERLENVSGVTAAHQHNQQITISGNGPLLAKVAAALAKHNIAPADLRVQQANLEDVFLALTGRTIRN